MSKLYEKYKNLKSQNENKLYLFKSGIFYIFLDNDAIKMSNLLNLKITKLNENVVKCGFPVKSAEKYIQLIKLNNYDLDIVDSVYSSIYSSNDYLLTNNAKEFIQNIAKIDYYNLSVSQVFSLIEDITNKAKDLTKYF